jgi:photosystem II stability/assembly factor-like uncharacterized protein
VDGGAKWSLKTSDQLIVNDILIDPSNPEHVLLATDVHGVLASNDGFAHYAESNRGFSRRIEGDVAVDRTNPNRLYVGVVNERELDGVFVSDDAGKSWRKSSQGIAQRDILSLQQDSDGRLFAGTDHGIFYLISLSSSWRPVSMIWGPVQQSQQEPETADLKPKPSRTRTAASRRNTSAAKMKAPAEPVIPADTAPKVRSLRLGKNAWYAATNEGLFISVDHGQKWYGQSVEGELDFNSVNNYDDGTVTLVSHKGAYLSRDWGKTWKSIELPSYVSGINNLSVMPDSSLWLSTRQGAMHSTDEGKSWRYALGGLPGNDVLDVRYDTGWQRLLATALHQYGVFESKDGGQSWQKTTDAPVSIRWTTVYQGHLLAVSSYNGLLLEQAGQSVIADSASVSNPSSAQHTQ